MIGMSKRGMYIVGGKCLGSGKRAKFDGEDGSTSDKEAIY